MFYVHHCWNGKSTNDWIINFDFFFEDLVFEFDEFDELDKKLDDKLDEKLNDELDLDFVFVMSISNGE